MLPRSFFFVRHGETDWNRNGVLQGFTDIPLNETGRAQARAAAAVVARHPIDRIVASPLSRAHETARLLNEVMQKPLSLCPDLRERNFGDLEGKTYAELEALRATAGQDGVAVEESGYPCPPRGEAYADFKARIVGSFTRALTAGDGGNVLFVCHGGIYRVLRRCLMNDVLHSGNVEPFHFEKGDGFWKVTALA